MLFKPILKLYQNFRLLTKNRRYPSRVSPILIQENDGKVEISCKGYPKQIGHLQPCGSFVDFIILDDGKNNRQPKRDKYNKRNDKRLHIKEEYAPRKIEDKADGIDKKSVVLCFRLACKNDCSADSH